MWFATTAWMLWNALVSGLLVRSTLVLPPDAVASPGALVDPGALDAFVEYARERGLAAG